MTAAHAGARVSCELPSLEIPAIRELSTRRQWVLWRFEARKGKPKPTKVPITTGGNLASTTKPNTWTTFEAACQAYANGLGDGVGYVFAADDPFFGVDLDGAIAADGTLAPWAEKIVRALNTYTEVSPSGTGLHLIGRGKLPGHGRQKEVKIDGRTVGKLEAYDRGRYFTITGRLWTA